MKFKFILRPQVLIDSCPNGNVTEYKNDKLKECIKIDWICLRNKIFLEGLNTSFILDAKILEWI